MTFFSDAGNYANYQLPDSDLLDYYIRLNNREIFVNSGIDTGIVGWTTQIVSWNKEDDEKKIPIEERHPIKIFINTNGGCLNSTMEFITLCNLSKTPVYTIGLGKCYSSGALLLMGAPKGNRLILPTTEALIHDGRTGFDGDTGKVIDELEYTRDSENRVKQFVLSSTKITEDEYDKNYRRNWWMNSSDIIKYGLADRVISNISELY